MVDAGLQEGRRGGWIQGQVRLAWDQLAGESGLVHMDGVVASHEVEVVASR